MSATAWGWLVLLFPLLGSIAIALGFRVLPAKAAGAIGTLAIALAFLCGIAALVNLLGDSPDGPFRYGGPLLADEAGSTYAGRVHLLDDELVLLAWHRTGADGSFVGTLSDPWPVVAHPDGRLEVVT